MRQGAVQGLTVTFEAGGTGRYSIPELSLFDEPLSEVRIDLPQLSFRLLYGPFTCVLHEEIGEITGINKRWGPPVQVHLKRMAESKRVIKEDISFTSRGTRLDGTLLLPNRAAPHAAVVLIHGSAQTGRNDWEYRGPGTILARHGVAVLLYDRRNRSSITKDAPGAWFDALADDAAAAAEFLAARPDIRKNAIGLFGASQGGWIAPLAAARAEPVSFFILQSAPAVSVWDQELQRIEYTMKAEGCSDKEVNEALTLARRIFAFAESGKGWDDLKAAISKARGEKWAVHVQLPESQHDAREWLAERYDPAPVLTKMRRPTLAMYGQNDTAVPPDANAKKLKELLAQGGNKDVTIKIFPGVGHGLELPRALQGGAWDWPDKHWVWPRTVPGYYETILDWLRARDYL